MPPLSFRLNGDPVAADPAPRRLLVHLLRDDLGLTGTKVGCDTSQCGACTVLVDGRAVKSCTLLAMQVQDRDVTTIEGVAPTPGSLHPLQAAFRQHHGLQCGFCTPGMVMTALDLLDDPEPPTESTIRHGLHGNLCRCTGYQGIVDAILAAADQPMASAVGAGTTGGDGAGRADS